MHEMAAGCLPRLRIELIRSTGSIRLAVIDSDSGFVRVLAKRLEGAGWQHRTLPAPVPVDELVAMRVNAVVVDLALFGPRAWDFLEQTSRDLPGLGSPSSRRAPRRPARRSGLCPPPEAPPPRRGGGAGGGGRTEKNKTPLS